MGRMYYKPRSHNFECDVCRGYYKAEDKKKRWDGSIVCTDCWDPKPWFMYRYPRVEDMKPVRNARPQSPFTFNLDGLTWDMDFNSWNAEATHPPVFLNWEE